MDIKHKATRINLFSIKTPQMRAFHMTWLAFFLCFSGWFGIAPLMPLVRDDLGLTQAQIGNTIIASVAITIAARLAIGWICDRYGPRRTYTWLLILGALPVMAISLAQDYTSFLLCRLAIGAIGASFVVTQFHTSLMFAPNVVGAANATTAGWGNLGGGVTQIVMPVLSGGLTALGLTQFMSWRVAMLVPGIAMLLAGLAYARFTVDAPDGDFADLRARGQLPSAHHATGTLRAALRDPRVAALFFLYAACFGVELTLNNIAALYFYDYFGLSLAVAGAVAGLFGMMNLFARALGGLFSDWIAPRYGLRGRVGFLGLAIFIEGVALIAFAQMLALPAAIAMLAIFSIFVQMSEGATYAVVPFINRRALGSVAGVVGAGGNFGAVLFGFLFKVESLPWPLALLILGLIVVACSFFALAVRFTITDENAFAAETEAHLATAELAAG